MSGAKRRKSRIIAAVAAAAAALVGVALLQSGYDVFEAANTIILQGTVSHNCTINVVSGTNAANLPLTAAGAQRVDVGTVTQSCNKSVGYTIEVASQNCGAQPTGAKIINPATNEYLAYGVEFANPATGNSQTAVTGLLTQACTGQFGRDVSGSKITSETSTVFVNFNGNGNLSAGTYQDVLTITMNVR